MATLIGHSDFENVCRTKKIGGADGAMALYADVFEKTLHPVEDEQDEDSKTGRGGGGGGGQGAGVGGGDGYPEFFVWHGTAVRAEYLGFGVHDGKPDRLWEEDSEQVLWERGGAYCPLAALLESVELLQLCTLSASLALPLKLAYAEDPVHRYTHRHIDTYTQAESNSSETQFEVLSSHGVSQTPVGEGGGGWATAGEGGLAVVAGMLQACGWGKGGSRFPTYDEMRRFGARKAATAMRTIHGGLRSAASKLWLKRADLGLAEDFVLEPLPYMLTDAASNDAVWLRGDDPTVLHEILAHSRVSRGGRWGGKGGLLETERGERLVVHYDAFGYRELDNLLAVFEMLWEDLEVVEEDHLPMYCELEFYGFQAAGEAILMAHGGLHEMCDIFDRKGPWQLPRSLRRQRRHRSMPGTETWHWTRVLRVVKQVADESQTPEMMPSYKTFRDEGLAPIELALRNRSTVQTRPSRRMLVPPSSSGRFWAAQQLGLLTAPQVEAEAEVPCYKVTLDRRSILEQYADVRVLRKAIGECARSLRANAPTEKKPMYSILYIPSYDDMLRTGNTIMADAVRSRKGGILSLLDLWDGSRPVVEGTAKDVRATRELLHPANTTNAPKQTARHANNTTLHQCVEEEEALMCGLLDNEQLKQGRRRVCVLPPASDSDEDVELEEAGEGS